MPKILPLILVFFFFLFAPHVSHAARSLSFASDKTALFGDEEMVLIASMSGFIPGETIYIKGAFYQDGSTNYFGYTKNGETWVKNGTSTTSQKQVKVGEWDGKLTVKADFSDSGYKGEGSYKLKVGFYYGSFSSVNWSSNTSDISLSEPDPTATPTQTPSHTATPKLSKTPTLTELPTKAPTANPTKRLSPSVTKKVSKKPTAAVLGSATKASERAKKTPTPSVSAKQNVVIKGASVNPISAVSIIVGGILIASCGILIFVRRKK